MAFQLLISKTRIAIWLEPEIFKLDPSEDIINILFLDELTTAQLIFKRQPINNFGIG